MGNQVAVLFRQAGTSPKFAVSDCGCGMRLVRSSIQLNDLDRNRWDKVANSLRVNKAALTGTALLTLLFLLSLRRCSTPALPAFRGLLLITAYMPIGVGSFFLLFVIPAVVFAIVSTIAIALVSLFRKDTAYAPNRFRQLLEFYRKHRMYQ